MRGGTAVAQGVPESVDRPTCAAILPLSTTMTRESAPRRITRTTFELRLAEGESPLRGDLRVAEGTRPRSAVVIVHGFKGFRQFGAWPSLARAFALAGHAAVNFDFSHNGIDEQGEFTRLDLFRLNTHSRERSELHAVLDALVSGRLTGYPVPRVGLLGHSRGGAAAILTASEDPRVRALVTLASVGELGARWSAEQVAAWRRGEDVYVDNARTGQRMPLSPEYWRDLQNHRVRFDLAAAAARVRVPWLIVHGDQDTTVPLSEAHLLFEAAGDQAELMVLEGADHGLGAKHPWPGPSDAIRTVTEAALDWFADHLG
jgi:pimeloyl-ACP methyl ester carboxylesterase